MRYWPTGTPVDTTCEGPGTPPFACSIDPDTMTLSWTDQGAYTYYLRHHINGADRYLGQTTDLEFPVDGTPGTYLVRYWPTGTPTDTTCELL